MWGDKILFLTAIETDRTGTPEAAQTPDPNAPAPFHGGKAPKNVYKFDVVCLDRATGKILWQKTAREVVPHEGHHPEHGFASYSPVTDGTHVWASFGSRGVHCYDLDGRHKWSRDLGRMRAKMMFGEGSSPALAGDALIVVMDQEDESFIYALNKNTGEILWKQSRDEDTSWATPAVAEVNGKMQVIVSATKLIRSYDVGTGELIWQCGGQTQNVIPSPIVVRRHGLLHQRLSRQRVAGDRARPHGRPDRHRGRALAGEQGHAVRPLPHSLRRQALRLLDEQGGRSPAITPRRAASTSRRRISTEVKDIYASPVGAAGRVYFVGRKGTTQVIANTGKFEILATNVLEDEFDASPAIAGNQILLKGKRHLYCISAP